MRVKNIFHNILFCKNVNKKSYLQAVRCTDKVKVFILSLHAFSLIQIHIMYMKVLFQVITVLSLNDGNYISLFTYAEIIDMIASDDVEK